MAVSKVTAIVLNKIGVDSILLDPAVSEIFYFKHDAEASKILMFIGNLHVDNISNIILVLS